jgi:hypothetical protein
VSRDFNNYARKQIDRDSLTYLLLHVFGEWPATHARFE